MTITAKLERTDTINGDEFNITLDENNVITLTKGTKSITFTKTQFDTGAGVEDEVYTQNFGLVGSVNEVALNKCYYDVSAQNIYIGASSAPAGQILTDLQNENTVKLVQVNEPLHYITGEIIGLNSTNRNVGQNNAYTLITIRTSGISPNGNDNSNYLSSNSNARLHFIPARRGLYTNITELISKDTQVDNIL